MGWYTHRKPETRSIEIFMIFFSSVSVTKKKLRERKIILYIAVLITKYKSIKMYDLTLVLL